MDKFEFNGVSTERKEILKAFFVELDGMLLNGDNNLDLDRASLFTMKIISTDGLKEYNFEDSLSRLENILDHLQSNNNTRRIYRFINALLDYIKKNTDDEWVRKINEDKKLKLMLTIVEKFRPIEISTESRFDYLQLFLRTDNLIKKSTSEEGKSMARKLEKVASALKDEMGGDNWDLDNYLGLGRFQQVTGWKFRNRSAYQSVENTLASMWNSTGEYVGTLNFNLANYIEDGKFNKEKFFSESKRRSSNDVLKIFKNLYEHDTGMFRDTLVYFMSQDLGNKTLVESAVKQLCKYEGGIYWGLFTDGDKSKVDEDIERFKVLLELLKDLENPDLDGFIKNTIEILLDQSLKLLTERPRLIPRFTDLYKHVINKTNSDKLKNTIIDSVKKYREEKGHFLYKEEKKYIDDFLSDMENENKVPGIKEAVSNKLTIFKNIIKDISPLAELTFLRELLSESEENNLISKLTDYVNKYKNDELFVNAKKEASENEEIKTLIKNLKDDESFKFDTDKLWDKIKYLLVEVNPDEKEAILIAVFYDILISVLSDEVPVETEVISNKLTSFKSAIELIRPIFGTNIYFLHDFLSSVEENNFVPKLNEYINENKQNKLFNEIQIKASLKESIDSKKQNLKKNLADEILMGARFDMQDLWKEIISLKENYSKEEEKVLIAVFYDILVSVLSDDDTVPTQVVVGNSETGLIGSNANPDIKIFDKTINIETFEFDYDEINLESLDNSQLESLKNSIDDNLKILKGRFLHFAIDEQNILPYLKIEYDRNKQVFSSLLTYLNKQEIQSLDDSVIQKLASNFWKEDDNIKTAGWNDEKNDIRYLSKFLTCLYYNSLDKLKERVGEEIERKPSTHEITENDSIRKRKIRGAKALMIKHIDHNGLREYKEEILNAYEQKLLINDVDPDAESLRDNTIKKFQQKFFEENSSSEVKERFAKFTNIFRDLSIGSPLFAFDGLKFLDEFYQDNILSIIPSLRTEIKKYEQDNQFNKIKNAKIKLSQNEMNADILNELWQEIRNVDSSKLFTQMSPEITAAFYSYILNYIETGSYAVEIDDSADDDIQEGEFAEPDFFEKNNRMKTYTEEEITALAAPLITILEKNNVERSIRRNKVTEFMRLVKLGEEDHENIKKKILESLNITTGAPDKAESKESLTEKAARFKRERLEKIK